MKPPVNACSDSRFSAGVSARLAPLEHALLRVDAGHGSVPALGAAAPVLVSATLAVRDAARATRPCRPRLVKARALLLGAARGLLSAGRELEPITGTGKNGAVFSESLFLSSWFQGTQDFETALVSLRAAGVTRLVSHTDGKGIFVEAGCAGCHTLAAAGAHGTVGPDLDVATLPKAVVVDAVTDGSGVMLSFRGVLSSNQIQAVSEFVSRNAGR